MADDQKVIGGSLRPDGTVRKERKVRPGFVPLEEMEKYSNSRMEAAKVPVGYIPGLNTPSTASSSQPKPDEALSKNAKKNAKKREKKKEAAAAGASGAGDDDQVDEGSTPAGSSALKAKDDSAASNNGQVDGPVELEKKLKALRKKLRQIEELEAKDASTLLEEQVEKISKKSETADAIASLEASLKKLGL
ncbi:hypothetical protein HDU97_006072 [Phlyctochytrium planicorne]|nr:hypothetical protein HDU97_006072 [Phlyctochytrium planicorne]